MKTLLLAIVCAIFAITLSGCGKKEEVEPVRVAYFPNITHTQALVMKEQGSLEEALGVDYEVTWTAFNAGPAEVEAFFAGEIDLGYIGPVPAINSYDKSQGDVSIIAGATSAGAVLVSRKDVVINEISDLSGKKIAIPQLGNTQHLSLLNLLSENNLSVTSEGGSVEVVASSNADILNLMQQGDIDAALVPEPWGSILEENANANVVLDYDEVLRDGDYPTAVVLVSIDFLEKHEDVVKQFLEVHKDTTIYINHNIEDAKQIVNKQIEEVTQKAIEDTILDTGFSRLIVADEISSDGIFDFAKISLQEGFIKQLPDEKLINDSLLQ